MVEKIIYPKWGNQPALWRAESILRRNANKHSKVEIVSKLTPQEVLIQERRKLIRELLLGLQCIPGSTSDKDQWMVGNNRTLLFDHPWYLAFPTEKIIDHLSQKYMYRSGHVLTGDELQTVMQTLKEDFTHELEILKKQSAMSPDARPRAYVSSEWPKV